MIQTQTEDINYLIHLSDNMGDSKVSLLAYIEYFYGKMTEEYEDAEFLVQSQEDIDKWICEFWNGDPDAIGETNWKLRELKIGQHMGRYEDFNDLLMIDPEDFVVTYFQQPSGKRTMWELNRVLGEMSVRELWDIHRKYPMARIEYLG